MTETLTRDEALRRAPDHAWYHTIDLTPSLTTDGWIDIRPLADRFLPGDLTGLDCLDAGTFDGFWAFELERRGAASVVAVDLPDGLDVQWPPNRQEENLALHEDIGAEWGGGFRIAAAARGSRAERIPCDVMALAPEKVGGPKDLVFCGTLLQHLRDPVGALERMRETLRPGGRLVLFEVISPRLTALSPRSPAAEFKPLSTRYTWWIPNYAALAGWAKTAGFAGPGRRRFARAKGSGTSQGYAFCGLTFTAPR